MIQDQELTLRDFFKILRRQRKQFLLCWGGIFLAVALYTATRTSIYRAQAMVKVAPPEQSTRSIDLGPLNVSTEGSVFDLDQLTTPQIIEETVRRLAPASRLTDSQYLLREAQDLGSHVNVDWSDHDLNLVFVAVLSQSPRTAAQQANMLVQVMIEQVTQDTSARAHRQKQFIEDQLKEVQEKLRDSEDRLRQYHEKIGTHTAGGTLLNRLTELRDRRNLLAQKYTPAHPELRQIAEDIREVEKQLQEVPGQEVDATRMSRDVHQNEELFGMLSKRLEDARILEAARLAPMTLVESAAEPGSPVSPNRRYNLMMGMVVGLLVGFVVVMIRQHFDTSITPEEIESYLQLPILATIPHIERRLPSADKTEGGVQRRPDAMGAARSRLLINFSSRSLHVEAHHLLRNNLMKMIKPGETPVFLFTSAVTGEGKSIASANFAIAAAQAGIPTLLVDADLRKPMVNKLFNIHQEPGLTDYFYSTPRWENCLTTWDQVEKENPELRRALNREGLRNLHLLPAGKLPPNPVPFLSSDRYAQLVEAMRKRFPLVVLDGAPALLFADSSIIGPLVDGAVLLYRFGRTPREILRRTHNQLVSSGVKVLGVVANDIAQGALTVDDNYYRHYSSYDRASPPAPPAAASG